LEKFFMECVLVEWLMKKWPHPVSCAASQEGETTGGPGVFGVKKLVVVMNAAGGHSG
jgi:hypothetical protein